jgi:amidohydrolase
MTDTCSACINDDAMADLVRRVGQRVIGTENVLSNMRTLAADDMSVFLEAVPGCYFFVGGANHERGLDSPHHSPTFDFDERALDVGVQMLTAVTLEFLSKNA